MLERYISEPAVLTIENGEEHWSVDLDRANDVVTVCRYDPEYKYDRYEKRACFPCNDDGIDQIEEELMNGGTPNGWEDGVGNTICI